MNVLYRVTPGIQADSHDYIVTGRKDSKFGIPLDDDVLYPAVRAALDSKWVNFLGFHFHVGSQLFDNAPYLAALEVVLGLVREVRRRFGHTVAELNLGGGFGVTYTDEARPPYAYFLDPLMARLEAFCQDEGMTRPAVVIEPGRSIVAEAGLSLYTVGSIKDIRGVRKYVSVDGGMTDNIRPSLYGAVYRGLLANRAEEASTDTATICGKCCESGDILIRDAHIPPARPGDLLAVFSTGAYGFSMASNYNSSPIPAAASSSSGGRATPICWPPPSFRSLCNERGAHTDSGRAGARPGQRGAGPAKPAAGGRRPGPLGPKIRAKQTRAQRF